MDDASPKAHALLNVRSSDNRTTECVAEADFDAWHKERTQTRTPAAGILEALDRQYVGCISAAGVPGISVPVPH